MKAFLIGAVIGLLLVAAATIVSHALAFALTQIL